MNRLANERMRLKGSVRIEVSAIASSAAKHALRMLVRDFEAVLGAKHEFVSACEGKGKRENGS